MEINKKQGQLLRNSIDQWECDGVISKEKADNLKTIFLFARLIWGNWQNTLFGSQSSAESLFFNRITETGNKIFNNSTCQSYAPYIFVAFLSTNISELRSYYQLYHTKLRLSGFARRKGFKRGTN